MTIETIRRAMQWARANGYSHTRKRVPEWGAIEHLWLAERREVRIYVRRDGYTTLRVTTPQLTAESTGGDAATILDALAAYRILPGEYSGIYRLGALAGQVEMARDLRDDLVAHAVVEQAGREVGKAVVAEAMVCPSCGESCLRDEADVGVGVIYGPWGCPCGWSESERFDVTTGPKFENGHRVDQWGGLTPNGGVA